ncbi:MAG TPA: TetR/AcrR family transcriptional regulator [Acidimicrobiales bacterium]|jgi:AcrR family transcriptional regulator|nr:TetR/AcrR family transcriptional regulator [Acidimicrobiales bacterium]
MAKAGPQRHLVTGGDELRARLINATIHVLARDGFAHTSARAIAQDASTVNGSIFYYFGSMDGLLAAAAQVLADRGIERIRQGLGGVEAHVEWPERLGAVLRAEAEGEDGRAVMELFVGARNSPTLAVEVQSAIDRAIHYATSEMQLVLGDSPITRLVPVSLIAELAAAAFLGIEVLAQNGRQIDLDRVIPTLVMAVQLLTGGIGAV